MTHYLRQKHGDTRRSWQRFWRTVSCSHNAIRGRWQFETSLCPGAKSQRWDSCEKQIKGPWQALSCQWEKQIMCRASSLSNNDTQAARCHPMVEYENLSGLQCFLWLLCSVCVSPRDSLCAVKPGGRQCVNLTIHFPFGFMASVGQLWPFKSHWSKKWIL